MYNFFFLYSFKKGTFSLEGGAIAPDAHHQLRHEYSADLNFPFTSSLHSVHSSYKTYIKDG